MNRKNLTAAVLAGLAGAAGIAGTAQAVNMNPDGLGQVLIYPYYTANDGNQTILSVVNTTDNAKAVKVRFLEGFNSREVLDFNLYLSHHDVWVAAIVNDPGAGTASHETDTVLIIPDDSCTVPYLYEDTAFELPSGKMAGKQPFLNLAYTGNFTDGGPTDNQRAAEGHFEMIEMGTIVPGSDTEDAITHQSHDVLTDPDHGDPVVIETFWAPGDCDELVDNWTGHTLDSKQGIWYREAQQNFTPLIPIECDTLKVGVDDPSLFRGCGQAVTDTMRNSGGLFGGGAVVNPQNGTMWSYDARAVQGFDKSKVGIHYVPGDIHPSLNDGNVSDAWVFFGVPQNTAKKITYPFTVDAVSAVFMHEFTMNEFTTADVPSLAATEWIVTFPTKNFYVDERRMINISSWIPGTCGSDAYSLLDARMFI